MFLKERSIIINIINYKMDFFLIRNSNFESRLKILNLKSRVSSVVSFRTDDITNCKKG